MSTNTHATFDRFDGQAQCNHCGDVWWPNLRTGGRLPRRWWSGPCGCAAAADTSTADTALTLA